MNKEYDPIVEILRLAYRRGLEIQRAQQQADPPPTDDKVESTGETDEHKSDDNPTNVTDRTRRD